MSKLVTDMPIWRDCPFRHMLPNWVEIRKDEEDNIVLWSPQHQLHVDISAPDGIDEQTVRAMFNSLGGAVFDREYPGEFGPLNQRRVAAFTAGLDVSESDKKLWIRLAQLTMPLDVSLAVH